MVQNKLFCDILSTIKHLWEFVLYSLAINFRSLCIMRSINLITYESSHFLCCTEQALFIYFFISKKLRSSVKSSYKAVFAASPLKIEGSLSIYFTVEFAFLFILTKKFRKVHSRTVIVPFLPHLVTAVRSKEYVLYSPFSHNEFLIFLQFHIVLSHYYYFIIAILS